MGYLTRHILKKQQTRRCGDRSGEDKYGWYPWLEKKSGWNTPARFVEQEIAEG